MILWLSQQMSENLLDRYKFNLRFVILDKTRKVGQLIFLHWKYFLFFKTFCFQQSLRFKRKALITSTVVVKLPAGTVKIVHWGLSLSIIREKVDAEKSYSLESLPSFSKHCVFNNLLGVTEMILWLLTANFRIPVGPLQSSFEVFHTL